MRVWADTKEYHRRIKAEIKRFSVSSIISIIGEKELLKGMDGKYGEGEQVLFFHQFTFASFLWWQIHFFIRYYSV